MRILAVSDLHGDLGSVREALAQFRPGALLCCGDWGDPGEVDEPALREITSPLPVVTTFGNHDAMEVLARLRNADGSPVLLGQGEVRAFAGLRVAAIGGIWAKSHRLPHYVTDEDVATFASKIARDGPVDVLMTHGCPIGLADLTPSGRHGGQRCFLDASRAIAPRLHLCGHLHVAHERLLKDGRKVLNVGATPEGSVVVIEVDGPSLSARLERLERGQVGS
jgi:uncharacterized protein